MIFIIDDDLTMAKCIKKAAGVTAKIFNNAIEAVSALNDEVPQLIFLDILLIGPDGFTFLNELVSYNDTQKIPVVIVSSFNFKLEDLLEYNVVGVLDKETMTPKDIKRYVEEYGQ